MNEAQIGSKSPGEEVVEGVGAWKKNCFLILNALSLDKDRD